MTWNRLTRISLPILALMPVVAVRCSTAYYSMWEVLGREERDLLRSNVESVQKIETLITDMRSSIAEAERFLSTLPE